MTRGDHIGDRPFAGIALGLLGIGSAVLMDASAKWLTASYPVGQIAFFRSFLALLPIGVLVMRCGGLRTLRTKHPVVQVTRGALMVGGMLTFFYGLKFIPLAESTAIFFTEPLFVIVLSFFLLKERADYRLLLVSFGGFSGVVLILRPEMNVLRLEVLYPLTSALLSALWMISGRFLGRSDKPLATSFFTTAVAAAIAGLVISSDWIAPSGFDALVFFLIGIFGGMSTYFYTAACYYVSASTIAPFDYLSILLAAIIGYAVWQELPDGLSWFGMSIIVVSGLYILYCKHIEMSGSQQDKSPSL